MANRKYKLSLCNYDSVHFVAIILVHILKYMLITRIIIIMLTVLIKLTYEHIKLWSHYVKNK
jgi:hypothetical protein